MKDKLDPMQSWTIPFVTDHSYRIHWAEGMDFTNLLVELSDNWEPQDDSVIINMNFTDVREAINFTTDYGKGEQIPNKTYGNKKRGKHALGDNIVFNDTKKREFKFVLNYKDEDRGKNLRIESLRCIHRDCNIKAIEKVVQME
jgi:hypothetical protein